MKFHLRISLLFFLVTGTLTQEFDLGDALNDLAPTPPKPKDPKKAPPKSDGDLNLFDAFGPGAPPTEKPKQPSSGGTGGFGFDLEDAVKPDPNPKPDKPAIDKPSGGGGRPFGDSDLVDVNEGDYTPDRGHSGGRASDPGYDQGGADQPQAEAGSGQIAGIASAIGVALLGAASSYFAYQKKKLCFKLQGGADPERGKAHQGAHSEPQVLSNLLQTNT
ncbi:CD99 antigen-like protein 2 isoform X1 [Parambassis ranga]|uniref:CD99 antigen-like protein 2 isoform X1 n=1 Tax=Parambassis ranga TaxID=210632 RepID=A0A6P7KEQ8_9TELE|nr:CD99 antigen-like protein 2 isoform X1 [Parambassis ranga]